MGKPTETKYDGWVAIPASSLEGDTSENWHIAEVRLDAHKETIIAFNATRTTCCGRQISKNAPLPNMKLFFPKGNDGSLRTNLANWQNGEFEFCGNCVGHFYKDHDK